MSAKPYLLFSSENGSLPDEFCALQAVLELTCRCDLVGYVRVEPLVELALVELGHVVGTRRVVADVLARDGHERALQRVDEADAILLRLAGVHDAVAPTRCIHELVGAAGGTAVAHTDHLARVVRDLSITRAQAEV